LGSLKCFIIVTEVRNAKRFSFAQPFGPSVQGSEDVSLSGLDLIEGAGATGRRGLRLGALVYLIGWWRGRLPRANSSHCLYCICSTIKNLTLHFTLN
jgi:hypothetical protein